MPSKSAPAPFETFTFLEQNGNAAPLQPVSKPAPAHYNGDTIARDAALSSVRTCPPSLRK